MKNYMDGGEAILEAFRKLKIDYIMSSPRIRMVARLGSLGAAKAR